MKGGSNIISGTHSIKQAFDHFESFQREYPGTKGARLFKGYNEKLEWVFKDLLRHPFLTESVREGIKAEWNSDVFAVPAIIDKVALLTPEQREFIEVTIDAMLEGEEIIVESNSK